MEDMDIVRGTPDKVASIDCGDFFAEARRRAEAQLHADAVWQRAYSETFSRIYDETLAELLAQQTSDVA
jgi:DNA-binding IscR family transcriptional regulator